MDELTQNADVFPVPSLPPVLLSSYSMLNESDKRIFIKMFRFVWGAVLPVRKFTGSSGLFYSYWAIDRVQSLSGLSSSSLAVLSYLYHISKHNKRFVNSSEIYNSCILPGVLITSKQKIISGLVVGGYIVRSFKDPDNPHYKKSFASHPVFVRLSVKGVHLIEDIEKDLYKILVNQSFEDLTGHKKEPRRSKSRL